MSNPTPNEPTSNEPIMNDAPPKETTVTNAGPPPSETNPPNVNAPAAAPSLETTVRATETPNEPIVNAAPTATATTAMTRWDKYQKIGLPTYVAMIQTAAVIVAVFVFFVQRDNLDNAKKDFNNRLTAQKELTEKVESQNADLKEQQKRLEETVKTNDERHAQNVKTANELSQTALINIKVAIGLQDTVYRTEYETSKRFHHIGIAAADYNISCYGFIRNLAIIELQRIPLWSADEQAFLGNIIAIATAQTELLQMDKKLGKDYRDEMEKNHIEYVKSIDNAELTPKTEAMMKYQKDIQRENERYQKIQERELKPIRVKLISLADEQAEIIKRMSDAQMKAKNKK